MIVLILDPGQPASPIVDGTFGSGSGPVFMTELNCDREARDLLSCANPQFVHFCSHEQDVGISCPGLYCSK